MFSNSVKAEYSRNAFFYIEPNGICDIMSNVLDSKLCEVAFLNPCAEIPQADSINRRILIRKNL